MSVNKFIISTNAKRSQIESTETHYKLKGIPITINDSVMNGVLYSKEENAKGIPSIKGKPFTIDHPADENGNFISALEGNGLMDYFSGGVVTNAYEVDDVWYVDAEIKKSLLAAQTNGKELTEKLEGKGDLGVSTGLYFENNQVAGTNSAGQDYSRVAMNQDFNHLAAVDNPAGGKGTTAVFNSDNTFECNFSDIKPVGPQNELIENDTFIEKVANKLASLKGFFANDNQTGYNNTDLNTNDEECAMRDIIEAKLAAKQIEVNGLDDGAKLEKYNEIVLAEKQEALQANSTETPAWASALAAKVESLESQLTANADKELNEVAEQVAALNKGLDAEDAKALGLTKAKAFLIANSAEYVANGYVAPHGRASQVNSDVDFQFTKPGAEA